MGSTLNTTRPLIAVAGQWRRGYARLPLPYVHSLESAGARVRVLSSFELPPAVGVPEGLDVVFGLDPHDPSPLEEADGLVIPGGGDIDPAWYGQPRHPRTHNVDHDRDRFERTLLDKALERDLPVLAICHGMQLLSVHLGGTLDQHLADNPERLEHDTDKPRAEPAHRVRVREDSILAHALGATQMPVNSAHHQGVEKLPPELEPVAWADDGVLEGVVMPERSWVVGVQWHPEAMAPVDPIQKRLFHVLVDAANERRRDPGATAQSA